MSEIDRRKIDIDKQYLKKTAYICRLFFYSKNDRKKTKNVRQQDRKSLARILYNK